MFGIPPNIVVGTSQNLLCAWQQTYTPSTPYNVAAAHTTTLVSSTTGIFQHTSTLPPNSVAGSVVTPLGANRDSTRCRCQDNEIAHDGPTVSTEH